MKIVVAIGGNALGNNPQEQKEIVKNTAKNLVDFVQQGFDLIIVHGNGPQVGMINNGFDLAHKADEHSPVVDFPECGAMSQGYIGYDLQNAIGNELTKRKMSQKVASIITQTIVDQNDPAFKNPTKPIGSFLSKAEAEKMVETNHWDIKEDAGRGWRRVIASPRPVDIVEKEIIKTMIAAGFITISTGGGGIPVVNDNNTLKGVAAVIDKDFAAAKVAELVDADKLIILTAVEQVAINYNKPDQQTFANLTLDQLDGYIKDGQFAPGSMLPKVEAAMSFVKNTQGRPAIIGSLDKAGAVIKGESGTLIKN
ncbi:Carbamate kinase 1 [Mesoplasma sp. JKS002660]|uniref:carbamate kinase n=1 Tax=Mesoplasma whartonense TaxID=2878854 RepID=UPI002022B349|nr:carbamate kinase [Mesoplasma sp. JKS002660]MCL8213484.1 Carbamate kinase 1 [Mesoplasma sp. JKS002660]